ncbi:hypothetical protein CPB86DRAFT_788522 [Serendipita vermifera]|nr:hypothetical protein CPB86DRAFT_788522 [Serendipita vermifera]
MVKTVTNLGVGATSTTRLANERANQPNEAHDIDGSIPDGTSEDQSSILASQASLLLLRWNWTHSVDDVRAVVSSLEKALAKLPHSSTKTRYDLLIRLANVHESWYQNSKDNPELLLRAIQAWEEAYSLSVVLHQIKEAANEVLPSLAKSYFVAFQDEISGIDSLLRAINYYQLALVQVRPEMQAQLRLGLGDVYLELMYYADQAENAQLAIDSFEVVLKVSNKKEELLNASNGKSQGWWWKLITEGRYEGFKQYEDFPFREWAKSVATTYPDNGVALAYRSLSFDWTLTSKEGLSRYHLAWSLLRSKRQLPPPGFHCLYFLSLRMQYLREETKEKVDGFTNLSILLSAIEHLELFAANTSLKDIHAFQREEIIGYFVALREIYLKTLTKICGDRNAVAESEEDFRVRLESRVVRPKNSPHQE